MKDTVIILAAATLALTLVALPFISLFIDIFSGAMAGHVPASPLPDPDKGFLSAFIDYYLGLTSGEKSVWTALAGSASCLLTTLLLYSWWLSQKQQAVSKGSLLGDAEVIDDPKRRRKANSTWDGTGTPKQAGLVLGFENGSYLFAPESPHCLTVGRTGSGKSRLILLPTLHLAVEAGFNVVVSDIKSELYELTANKVSEKAEVVLLDLESPMKGNRFNPLEIITEVIKAGDEARARDYADRLAADLVPRKTRTLSSPTQRGACSARASSPSRLPASQRKRRTWHQYAQ